MSRWSPMDFGYPLSGIAGLIATGNNQATAVPVEKKINVFQTVPPGSGCLLPSSYSPGAEIYILNRGANPLITYPSKGDQIENYGIDTGASILAGATMIVTSFDQPLTHSPRTWWGWLAGGTGGGLAPPLVPGSGGLENDNGVLVLTDMTGWPTSGGAPGTLYADAGPSSVVATIGCVPPTNPDPGAAPIVFGFISSSQLLLVGGANLPNSGPAPGSNIIWNNAGLLCVA